MNLRMHLVGACSVLFAGCLGPTSVSPQRRVDDRPILVLFEEDRQGTVRPLELPYSGGWIPEGARTGDELVPSEESQDFVIHLLWKPAPDTPAGLKTPIAVTLVGSNHRGSASNTGELELPDLTIEQERNRTWEIVGPDIPEYRGRQAGNTKATPAVTTALSRPVGAGERIELRITCYDWMGFGTLIIEAGARESWKAPSRPATVVRFPADFDGNEIPDALERRHR